MRRRFTALGALAAAATIAWSADSFAQLESVEFQPRATEAAYIEGKVAGVEPGSAVATTVKLEDGSRLIVLASSLGPPAEPRTGDVVRASYVESMAGDKLVTTMRVDEVEAP